MSNEGSITRWIHDLRTGDSVAAVQLGCEYFARMVALARQRLAVTGRTADDEDAALSAFKSFCLGARAGRFPQLRDRDNLWPLLIALTVHKCVDYVRRETRLKRGGTTSPVAVEFETVMSQEPTPEMLAEINERLTLLLEQLDATGDPVLRKVALWRLEGDTAAEIAGRLGCAKRTIERKIQVIEQVWDRAESPDEDHR